MQSSGQCVCTLHISLMQQKPQTKRPFWLEANCCKLCVLSPLLAWKTPFFQHPRNPNLSFSQCSRAEAIGGKLILLCPHCFPSSFCPPGNWMTRRYHSQSKGRKVREVVPPSLLQLPNHLWRVLGTCQHSATVLAQVLEFYSAQYLQARSSL